MGDQASRTGISITERIPVQSPTDNFLQGDFFSLVFRAQRPGRGLHTHAGPQGQLIVGNFPGASGVWMDPCHCLFGGSTQEPGRARYGIWEKDQGFGAPRPQNSTHPPTCQRSSNLSTF